MSVDFSEMSIDQLLMNATQGIAPAAMHYLKVAEIRLQQEQIELTHKANELSTKLLLSNEQASIQSNRNADLMNQATQGLAQSTKSLKWATWVLVVFTAVQALIAFAALFKH